MNLKRWILCSAVVALISIWGDCRKGAAEVVTVSSELTAAIRHANVQDMKRILNESSEQVNARDSRGWTPLMLASFYANAESVRLLLESDADVNAVKAYFSTELMNRRRTGTSAHSAAADAKHSN